MLIRSLPIVTEFITQFRRFLVLIFLYKPKIYITIDRLDKNTA